MEQASAKILIIDDDSQVRYSLKRVLGSHRFAVVEAGSGEEGVEVASREQPDVIFLDHRMEGMSGLEALQHLKGASDRFLVVMMTAFGTTKTAIEAMKFGAFDYIVKPFDVQQVLQLVNAALEAKADRDKTEAYEPLLDSDDYTEGIVGSSQPMQEVYKQIGQIAASDVTVLITGESGTGKELIAKAIYRHSLRSSGPYVPVNCATIPENLIESELFGHEKGAFTGAAKTRKGTFEICDLGTIFLDEIGDMALATQTKILRVLQEGEIQRVGGSSPIKVDVRLIAATNKDLENLVEKKQFREDLYYRLHVARIRLPKLLERNQDIPELVDFMLQRQGKKGNTQVKRVSADAKTLLIRYPWPGNVRQLENVINRACVIAQGDTILVKDLPQELTNWAEENGVEFSSGAPAKPLVVSEELGEEKGVIGQNDESPTSGEGDDFKDCFDQLYRMLRQKNTEAILKVIEGEMIRRALAELKGNQVKVSRFLGMTRATLRKRIEKMKKGH